MKSHLQTALAVVLAPMLSILGGCAADEGHLGQSQLAVSMTGTNTQQEEVDGTITGTIIFPRLTTVVVTIDQILLVPSDAENDAVDPANGDNDANEPVVLLDEAVTLNLMALPNLTTELVKEQWVPAGRYNQIRCFISGGYINVMGDGIYATPDYDALPQEALITGELLMPSLAESGLKIKLDKPLILEAGAPKTTLDLRFNVRDSFGHAVNEDKWVMHPVISATAVE